MKPSYGKIPLLFVTLLATACDAAPPSVNDTKYVASPATLSCPAQDFGKFLTAFANHIEVQKAFVTLPLESESVDATAEPEPKPVTKRLGLSELHFPLMPSLQRQAMDGVTLSRKLTNPKEAEVKLVKEDTDYQMVFYFKNDGCWKLYRMRDDSL